jgi:sugar phosphate isomerase/epimerase
LVLITALNPATIGGEPPLLEYIALAEKFGFGGVEFSINAVTHFAQETSWDTVRNAFEQYGVAPALFGLPVEWRKDDNAFAEDLKHLAGFAASASEIGCTRAGTWLPPAIDGSADEFRRQVCKRFQLVAPILADFNISLALEFVGPVTCRTGPNAHGKYPFIYTMGQTLDLIDEVDAPANNIGLLIDSFHWYTSGATIENILMLRADQVVHVHINDAPNRPLKEQMDFERLLPGEGVINLKGFLRTLAQVGYDGYVAVETFNKELGARGFEEAAQLTELSVERLLATL